MRAPDLDSVVSGQRDGELAMPGRGALGQQTREECERPAAGRSEDLTTRWIDKGNRPTAVYGPRQQHESVGRIGGD